MAAMEAMRQIQDTTTKEKLDQAISELVALEISMSDVDWQMADLQDRLNVMLAEGAPAAEDKEAAKKELEQINNEMVECYHQLCDGNEKLYKIINMLTSREVIVIDDE